MARIEAEMGGDTGSEIGGVLVGNAAPSTNFVLVTGSVPAPLTDVEAGVDGEAAGSQTGQFTFTAASLEDLSRQVAATYPGQRIVGWYHSHPRAGIFLSAHDLYIQSAFFAQSWQVGYVYDPVQAQRGFFGWSAREVVRVPHWEITSVSHGSGADLPVNAPAQTGAATVASTSATAVAPVTGLSFGDAPASATAGRPTSPPAPSAANVPSSSPSSSSPAARKRPIGAIVGAIAAVIAIIVAIVVITGGDDDDTSTSDTTIVTESSVADSESTAASSAVTTTEPATESSATSTTAEVTTTTAAADVSTTAPAPITFPATPTAVAAPAARVGEGATACERAGDGSYAPLSDCFVPLNNGNVMVFVAGSLRCVDPNGQVLANEAQSFTIGVAGDPIVLVADGVLNPTCIDLTYAKNVLTGGSDTYDGLCGSSGTQINDGTRRCIAQNLSTGAMVAMIRGEEDQGDLVAACKTGTEDAAIDEITWSDGNVGTDWKVDSVVYQQDANQFIATASRPGSTATATFSCG